MSDFSAEVACRVVGMSVSGFYVWQQNALDRWLAWARRSQLPSLVYLATRTTKDREVIEANLEDGIPRGLVESTNTMIRLLARISLGFHGPEPLIAFAMLALGSHLPQLPGRT
jgi:transposase